MNVGEERLSEVYSDIGTCGMEFAPLSSSGSMTESDIWSAEERKTHRRETSTREKTTCLSPGSTRL